MGRIQSGTDRIQSGSTVPLPPASGPGGMYTPFQVLELQRTAVQYRLAYEDSERTHQLRDQTESALKEEIAKQQVGGWQQIEEGVLCTCVMGVASKWRFASFLHFVLCVLCCGSVNLPGEPRPPIIPFTTEALSPPMVLPNPLRPSPS